MKWEHYKITRKLLDINNFLKLIPKLAGEVGEHDREREKPEFIFGLMNIHTWGKVE